MFVYEWVRREPYYVQLVWEWRQDPVAREMSFHSEPETLEQFAKRFEEDFAIGTLPPLLIWEGDERVAYVKFLPVDEAGWVEIGVMVHPVARRRGIGAAVLKEMVEWVQEKGFRGIQARIKKGNIASLKAFEKAGYRRSGEKENVFSYRLELGMQQPVLVIAEAGSNWADIGLEGAYRLIEAAAEAGADVVKFQMFRGRDTYVENAGVADYLGQEIQSLFQELELPDAFIPDLVKRCEKAGVEFMASVFSLRDLAVIDPYVKRHKIGSYEISYPQLIAGAVKTGKPLYLSTGVSTAEDIAWAVSICDPQQLTLLQCTGSYPAPLEEMNLHAIAWLRDRFHVPVGLSDHSENPLLAPIAAVTLGATAIEKHFTLDKKQKGPDHKFAVEPHELKTMVQAIRNTEKALGTGFKKVLPSEQELYLFARRSVQATRDIAVGEILRLGQNLGVLRPGKQKKGMHPRYLLQVEGKKALRSVPKGDGIQEGDF